MVRGNAASLSIPTHPDRIALTVLGGDDGAAHSALLRTAGTRASSRVYVDCVSPAQGFVKVVKNKSYFKRFQ